MTFISNYSCCRESCHQMEALQYGKYMLQLQETVADLRRGLIICLVMKSQRLQNYLNIVTGNVI